MSLPPDVLKGYWIRDQLSWLLLLFATLCGGVVVGVGLCDLNGLALTAEIAAVYIVASVVLLALGFYLDWRARALLRAATGFSSLRLYLEVEGDA